MVIHVGGNVTGGKIGKGKQRHVCTKEMEKVE